VYTGTSPLADIFNSLMKHSRVPKEWLDSEIPPVSKPGKSKEQLAGWRPIGGTCILSRTMDGREDEAVDLHLEANKLMHISQQGFQRVRGCNTNLLELKEYLADRAEESEPTDSVYIDMQAYFDEIPHVKMLGQLDSHGIVKDGDVHKWIKVWLGATGLDGGRRRQKSCGRWSQPQ
jgi:hypothetical protein